VKKKNSFLIAIVWAFIIIVFVIPLTMKYTVYNEDFNKPPVEKPKTYSYEVMDYNYQNRVLRNNNDVKFRVLWMDIVITEPKWNLTEEKNKKFMLEIDKYYKDKYEANYINEINVYLDKNVYKDAQKNIYKGDLFDKNFLLKYYNLRTGEHSMRYMQSKGKFEELLMEDIYFSM
jgi:hypothetical protein